MRVLGVDLGRRRTGLALSDPHGLTCSPLGVLEERNEEQLLRKIMHAAEEQRVGLIVVGLPRPLGGGTNAQVEEVLAFVRALGDGSPVPVVTWDERFTSKLADKKRGSGHPQDAVAACYMLQSYLDSRACQEKDA